jgi:hypothetical protein
LALPIQTFPHFFRLLLWLFLSKKNSLDPAGRSIVFNRQQAVASGFPALFPVAAASVFATKITWYMQAGRLYR